MEPVAGTAPPATNVDAEVSNIASSSTLHYFKADSADDGSDDAAASGKQAVVAGANANASGASFTVLGANSIASQTAAIAVGSGATASGAGGTAIGTNSSTTTPGSVALDNMATSSADGSVALGQGSVADRANTLSVGSPGSERQITHVAAGVQGTDAVNVNRLNQGMASAEGRANSYTDDDRIRFAQRDPHGGTASALAAAVLPQAVLPGHGLVAVAAGTYAGQSAIALGVSQLSETRISSGSTGCRAPATRVGSSARRSAQGCTGNGGLASTHNGK